MECRTCKVQLQDGNPCHFHGILTFMGLLYSVLHLNSPWKRFKMLDIWMYRPMWIIIHRHRQYTKWEENIRALQLVIWQSMMEHHNLIICYPLLWLRNIVYTSSANAWQIFQLVLVMKFHINQTTMMDNLTARLP